jgi:hypothetical protein
MTLPTASRASPSPGPTGGDLRATKTPLRLTASIQSSSRTPIFAAPCGLPSEQRAHPQRIAAVRRVLDQPSYTEAARRLRQRSPPRQHTAQAPIQEAEELLSPAPRTSTHRPGEPTHARHRRLRSKPRVDAMGLGHHQLPRFPVLPNLTANMLRPVSSL